MKCKFSEGSQSIRNFYLFIFFFFYHSRLKNDTTVDSSDTDVPQPQLLKFNVSPEVRGIISKAMDTVDG